MRTKVTVQDIADALKLSRTTVSKVLNNAPSVSDITRNMVLEKARELGYRTIVQPDNPPEEDTSMEVSCFALVMHAIPGGNHMGTAIIPSMDQKLRQEDISLLTCVVSDEDYNSMTLPPILSHSQVKAIACLELFHPEYSKLLCSLGKPVLFIDACPDFYSQDIPADLLLMENRNSTRDMLVSIIRQHKIRTVGFIGDADHCISFRERYEAFQRAAVHCHAEWENFCIKDSDKLFGNMDWLCQQLESMESLPELFFCANDFLAVVTIHALEAIGKKVPQDVKVCGFDGMPSLSWPLNQLTTVVTPVNQIGTYAANILLRKIVHKEPPGSATYLRTYVIFRETTS